MTLIRYIFLGVFAFWTFPSFSQSPISNWHPSIKNIESNYFEIVVNGKLRDGWYIYAKNDEANQLTGPQILWDSGQHVKVSIPLKVTNTETIRDLIFNTKTTQVYKGDFQFSQPVEINGAMPWTLKIIIHAFVANGKEFEPVDEARTLIIDSNKKSDLSSNQILIKTIYIRNPKFKCGEAQNEGSKSILNIFLLGFLGGLIALLIPCVFPMIPVMVSFLAAKRTAYQIQKVNIFLSTFRKLIAVHVFYRSQI